MSTIYFNTGIPENVIQGVFKNIHHRPGVGLKKKRKNKEKWQGLDNNVGLSCCSSVHESIRSKFK